MRSHSRGAAHPQHGHTTIRSRKLVDPNKFETEPLPREMRGFQPRGYSQTSEAASSVVTEQHPRTFTSPQEILSRESAVQPHIIGEPATIIDDSLASRTIENPETVISNRVIPLANNARKANQARPMAQFSAAKALTNERSNAGILPEDVKIPEQLDQNGGLGASMWAQPPQKSLSNLPGLRSHPNSPPKWDSSNGFKVASDFGGRYSINLLPKYAYNNGVKPKTTNNSTGPTNDITMPPREIPSADTKDANTTARTREEHNSTVVVSDAVVTTSPNPVSSASRKYVPPHLLPPHLRKQNMVTMDRDVPQHLPISEPQQKNIKVAKASSDKSTEANLESSNLLSTKPSATRSTNSAQYQIPTTGVSPVIVSSSPLAESSPPAMSQYKTETSVSYPASPVLLPSTPGEAILVSDSAKAMKEMEQKLPPHLRAPKAKPASPEPQQETKHQKHSVLAMNAGGNDKIGKPGKFEPVSLEGKASEANVPTEELGDDIGNFAASAAAPNVMAVPETEKKGKEKAINGWDKPIEPPHELLGWDGARAEPNEDWEGRPRDKIPVEEQLLRLEYWNQANELSASQNSAHVDTASPEFIQGAGIADDGSLSNVHSEDAHRTFRLPNDPLTLAKADQTTQSVLEKLNVKRREETPRMTKQERRDLRAALNQRNKECADMPNPYKPAADIYIRPAQVRDVPQITDIYNHYIKTSAVALELDPMTHDQWRTRMEDCRDEGYDMYVAVQRTANGNGQSRKDSCEPVFGFAYAEDQNDRRSSCRLAAVAQVYVNWKHLQVGVGRCLLDRVMAMLNINHCPKQGVEWVGDMPLVQRGIKKVLIEIPYWDDSEEERAIFTMAKNQKTGQVDRVPGWKARWLESVQFEHEGTLRAIGFKKACLEKGKSVSIATFMLDTWIDISKMQDWQ